MNEIDIVDKVLGPIHADFVMIDIGGHFGSSCLRFARRDARVFVFEPDDQNRQPLQERLSAFPNVSIDTRAVSDKDGDRMPWFRSDESTGISGLNAFRETHQAVAEVTTVTLATFCAEHQISKIDFLKIDTEGYDFPVLRSHNWDDKDLSPKAIVCEFEDSKTESLGYTWSDMAEFLKQRGYSVIVSEWHPIVRYGIKHQWRRFVEYPCALKDENAWGNLIAWRDASDYQTALEQCQSAEADYHSPPQTSKKPTPNSPSLIRRILRKAKSMCGL